MRKRVCCLLSACVMVMVMYGAALAEEPAGPVSNKGPAKPNVIYLELDRPLESSESVSKSPVIIHSNDIWTAIQSDANAETWPTSKDIGSRPVAAKLEFDLKLNRNAGALTLNFFTGDYEVIDGYKGKEVFAKALNTNLINTNSTYRPFIRKTAIHGRACNLGIHPGRII